MSSRDRGSPSSSSSSSSLPGIEKYNEKVKNQIQALVRVIKVARTYRDDNVPSLIEQGLYLGSVAAASNKNVLKSYNVTHILTVASSLRPAHPDDFVYKVVRVVDKEDTNLEMYFDECVDFIDEAKRQGGSVLVHCFVGKSRSVTIVVAYLMKKHGMTLAQALQHVKSKRPVASPNAGFIRQLQDLEKSMQGMPYYNILRSRLLG
ncbi:Dual specificity phosphatase catalytic domain [Arabidopsis suecica]|jgi:protein phosphatase slingshot|nr:dual specificity protein phosphatase 1 [Arabidopsis thaliana]ANM64884.1 dual specificity protein phosphatase 1 [Arabidopsis thaliana]KAG7632317.1 Dual specificity phosphatase catalytic domain [Arabidopsis suecica]|eukprot:NP_001326887.1 dual specificity protein phosphatase 1 [Arabidopsis thaliana]